MLNHVYVAKQIVKMKNSFTVPIQTCKIAITNLFDLNVNWHNLLKKSEL